MTELVARARAARMFEIIAVVLAFAGALLTARMDAGLAGPWVLIGLASAVPLYLVGRGWRLPWWAHAVAAALPAAVIVAGLAHGYGDGLARASRYGYAAILVLALAAWARTPNRRLIAGVGFIVLIADGYLTAWWIWWGQNDPTRLMFGNFYWHNQFGTYMVLGIAMAAVLAVAGRRVFALLGFVVAFLAGAGVISSGSRASVALAIVALVLALLIGLTVHGWRGIVRALVLPVGIAATTILMTSSIFFPAHSDAGSGAQLDRLTNGRTAESSVADRLNFWVDALRLGAGSPVTGVGLQAFGPRLQCMRAESYSSHPHNEYLLAWAETGAVGVLPFLAILVGAILLVIRSFRRPADGAEAPRRISWIPGGAEFRADPARWGALIALVIALGHAAFDFDWAYPALLGAAGIVGGIAAAPVIQSQARSRSVVAINLVLLGVLVAAAITGFVLDPLPSESLRPLPMSGFDCPTG